MYHLNKNTRGLSFNATRFVYAVSFVDRDLTLSNNLNQVPSLNIAFLIVQHSWTYIKWLIT